MEESIHVWFNQNRSHCQTPVTSELVELEETKNARRLDACDDTDINEALKAEIDRFVATTVETSET